MPFNAAVLAIGGLFFGALPTLAAQGTETIPICSGDQVRYVAHQRPGGPMLPPPSDKGCHCVQCRRPGTEKAVPKPAA
jgi:hypothetical protein